MPEPQAVLAPLTRAAFVLVVTVDPGEDNAARVRSFAADLPGLVRSVGFRDLDAGLSCVAGFGSDVWPRLFRTPPPAQLHPFRALAGDRHRAPATPGDLVLHIRAGRPDLCFELATQALTALGGAVTPVDEMQGFRFFDFRDLLGFVDGTENPTGQAAAEAALIGPEDPLFAGGSYLMVQRYQHDLAAWNALSVEEQQLAIGRDKLSNVELPDEDVPPSRTACSPASPTTAAGSWRSSGTTCPSAARRPVSSARTSSATRRPRRCWSGCCTTWSSGTHPARTTGSWTSRPRSPGACSSCRRRRCSTSSPTAPADRAPGKRRSVTGARKPCQVGTFDPGRRPDPGPSVGS